jgi:hypothetical protein
MITLVVPPAHDDATFGTGIVLVPLCPILPMVVVGAQSPFAMAMNAIWPWLLLAVLLSLRVPSLPKALVGLCLVLLAGLNAIHMRFSHLSDALLWACSLLVSLAWLNLAQASVRSTRNRNDH